MGWFSQFRSFPLGAVLACGMLSACTQAPDMSGIENERLRPVQRYDIGQAIAARDQVVIVGTQSGVALVSNDAGRTWRRQALGQASLVDLAVCGEGFIAIDHYHKVWSADAEGGNWQAVNLELPKTPLAVACDKQGNWWVAGVRATLATSKDKGATWRVTDLGEDAQITTLQFLDDKQGLAFGEFGMALSTADGGATWQKGPKVPNDFYPYAALFTQRNEGWLSGIAGQILHTTDGGKTWQKQANTSKASLYRLFLHEGVPYGVGAVGTIARLEEGTWRQMPYPDPVPVFLSGGASLPNQSAVLIGGPGGLVRAVSTAAKQ